MEKPLFAMQIEKKKKRKTPSKRSLTWLEYYLKIDMGNLRGQGVTQEENEQEKYTLELKNFIPLPFIYTGSLSAVKVYFSRIRPILYI